MQSIYFLNSIIKSFSEYITASMIYSAKIQNNIPKSELFYGKL